MAPPSVNCDFGRLNMLLESHGPGENDPPEQSFEGHGWAGSPEHASEDTDDRCAKHREADDLESLADRSCIGDSVARRSRF